MRLFQQITKLKGDFETSRPVALSCPRQGSEHSLEAGEGAGQIEETKRWAARLHLHLTSTFYLFYIFGLHNI